MCNFDLKVNVKSLIKQYEHLSMIKLKSPPIRPGKSKKDLFTITIERPKKKNPANVVDMNNNAARSGKVSNSNTSYSNQFKDSLAEIELSNELVQQFGETLIKRRTQSSSSTSRINVEVKKSTNENGKSNNFSRNYSQSSTISSSSSEKKGSLPKARIGVAKTPVRNIASNTNSPLSLKTTEKSTPRVRSKKSEISSKVASKEPKPRNHFDQIRSLSSSSSWINKITKEIYDQPKPPLESKRSQTPDFRSKYLDGLIKSFPNPDSVYSSQSKRSRTPEVRKKRPEVPNKPSSFTTTKKPELPIKTNYSYKVVKAKNASDGSKSSVFPNINRVPKNTFKEPKAIYKLNRNSSEISTTSTSSVISSNSSRTTTSEELQNSRHKDTIDKFDKWNNGFDNWMNEQIPSSNSSTSSRSKKNSPTKIKASRNPTKTNNKTCDHVSPLRINKFPSEVNNLEENTPRIQTNDQHQKKLVNDEPTETNKIEDDEVFLEDAFNVLNFGDDEQDNLYYEARNSIGNELTLTELEIDRISDTDISNENVHISLEDLTTSGKDEDLKYNMNKFLDDEIKSNEKIIGLNITESNLDSCTMNQSFLHFGNPDDQLMDKPNNAYNTFSFEGSTSSSEFDLDKKNSHSHEDDEDDVACRNTERETIVDPNGYVRIERVSCITRKPSLIEEEKEAIVESSVETEESTLKKKAKMQFIVEELLTTEVKYVNDMGKIVEKYIPYIEKFTPDNLLGKSCYIFANLQHMYIRHLNFLDDLKECDKDVYNVAVVFIKHKPLFEMYPTYCKNKPKADIYLKDFYDLSKNLQRKLGDKIDLPAYLLSPIQRIGKYILLLENIIKELKKQNEWTSIIEEALRMLKEEMRKGNDAIAIDSIENCPLRQPIQYGSFIMRDKLTSTKGRKGEFMVFLFEQVIIFTHILPKDLERFEFAYMIDMTELSILHREMEPLQFELATYRKDNGVKHRSRKSWNFKHGFVLKTKSEKSKQIWTKAIEDILWQQVNKMKADVDELYGVDVVPSPAKVSPKTTGNSVFYITE